MDLPLVSVQPYSVCSIFSMDMSSQKRLQFPFLSDPTTRRGHSANIVDFLPSGHISEFEIVDDHRSNKIVIQLNGRLNQTGVISPVSTSNTLKSSPGSTCSSLLEVSESSSFALFVRFLTGVRCI
jgi:hypothetical protein